MIVVHAATAVIFGDERVEQGDPKPEFAQQPCEQTVEFVTESAALIDNDLFVQSCLFQDDASVEVDIEILKRDSKQVGAVQVAQSLGCGLGRAVIVDSL